METVAEATRNRSRAGRPRSVVDAQAIDDIESESAGSAHIEQLRGAKVLVLNWKDIEHPSVGGAELYMHEIARRWVQHGVEVTWVTSRPAGAARLAEIDGISVIRMGSTFGVYPRVAAWLTAHGREFDAVVDCQNGIPFFGPLFAGRRTPLVQVIHHVHQDQFATHFPAPAAAVGRVLEGPVSRRVYGRRPIAAVSVSTRDEIRAQLHFAGDVYVVPNGSPTVPADGSQRSPLPRIALVTRLAPHKRVDEVLRVVDRVRRQVPGLQVDIVGGGTQLDELRGLSDDLGLGDTVTLHGRQPDEVRDDLLRRSWLTLSMSDGEGWSCSVMEAAAWGVPCVALAAPGVRDSVVDGTTGWLVPRDGDYAESLASALHTLADPATAALIAAQCRSWSGAFSWDRSANLLAGVLRAEMDVPTTGSDRRLSALQDASTVLSYPGTALPPARLLRATDEVRRVGDRVDVLLHGCDDAGAVEVLRRLDVPGGRIRPAETSEMLAGPGAPRLGRPLVGSRR